MTDQTFTMRCRAFSREGVRENRVKVDTEDTVRVWDSVAGHYTTCHIMARSAIARARKRAYVYAARDAARLR